MQLGKLSLHWVIIISLFMLSLAGYHLFNASYVYTSDAYVQALNVSISPEVSGQVTQVFVKEGQLVQKGDKLFQIDPSPYAYLRDYALGTLQSAIQSKDSLKETINAAKANLVLAQTTHTYNKRVWSQKRGLVNVAITGLEGEGALYDLHSSEATVQAEKHALLSDQAALGKNKGIEYPSITVAKANLKSAIYNLNRTTVTAPFSGYVTNMYLTPGTHLSAGSTTFAIVKDKERWILARYKESYLHNVHIGDHASIHFRIFPNETLHGTVTSIGLGVNRQQNSAAVVSSALPYLDQTEDWVELDQRFPVRITLDAEELKHHRPIPVGSSASVFIKRR